MTKLVFQKIDCVMECSGEPCCRSVNYKKTSTSQNEPNCEMLHNVFNNTSEKILERNNFFDHVHLVYPVKVKWLCGVIFVQESSSFPRLNKNSTKSTSRVV